MSYNLTLSNNNKELKEEITAKAKEEGLTLSAWAIIELKKAVKRSRK